MAEHPTSTHPSASVHNLISDHDKRVLFASCNRQRQPQSFWSSLEALKPAAFLWTGDAVYAKDNTLEKLHSAYRSLLLNENWSHFASSTSVSGTWDDHDYGVNDGGNLVSLRQERKKLFLDFIDRFNVKSDHDSDEDSQGPVCSAFDETLAGTHESDLSPVSPPTPSELDCASNSGQEEEEEGVFSSFTFGESPMQVKVLLLDTRYDRDSHWLRSIGEVKWLPLSALIAAALRVVTTFLDIGNSRRHEGDMLGGRQWAWLENELGPSSTADFHVIVSSVQIFTTNPAVESWGHFPLSKRRLVNILTHLRPRGVAFLSGDVHHGEAAHPLHAHSSKGVKEVSTAASRDATVEESESAAEGAAGWVEVTSSGLTHTCAESLLTSWLCPRMLQLFHHHRQPSRDPSKDVPGHVPSSSPTEPSAPPSMQPSLHTAVKARKDRLSNSRASPQEDGYFIGKNFGSLETFRGDESNNFTPSLIISVHDLQLFEGAVNDVGGRSQEGVQDAFMSSVVLQQRVYSQQSVRSQMMHYQDFPCVWDHLPNSWQELIASVFQLKSLLLLGVAGCMYFQWRCFCLLRAQLHLYSKQFEGP